MTLRMKLAYVALAALAVLIADVAAVHAATKTCDVMPWRCRYNADGRKYYWTPDRHMPAYGAAPSTGTGAATSSHAWGCSATDGQARGRSWGFSNKAAASFQPYAPKAASLQDLQAMVRYHTHHHHPVGAVLKQELKAYADDLKLVSVFKPSTDTAKFAERIYVDVFGV